MTKSRRGFSLVSMLVAMVLLGVGIGALARANANTMVLQTLAQNRTNAIAIGRSQLELVRTKNPWVVTSEASVNVDENGRVAAGGRYARSVVVTVLRQNLIRVEVIVNYPRAPQPIRLHTLVFRGNGLSGAS